MPAIQITRLRIQVARLLEHFDQPEQFGRSLADLLDFYSDRARRTGKLTALAPIQKQYRVHPAVLNRSMTISRPTAGSNRNRRHLWRNICGTIRIMSRACWLPDILSMLPDEAGELITAKLIGWARPGQDRVLVDVLLQKDDQPA